MKDLYSLRIPSGWEVGTNYFYRNIIEDDKFCKEGILFISGKDNKNNIHFDLTIQEDFSMGRYFYLTMIWNDSFGSPIEILKTQSADEILEKLEDLLEKYSIESNVDINSRVDIIIKFEQGFNFESYVKQKKGDKKTIENLNTVSELIEKTGELIEKYSEVKDAKSELEYKSIKIQPLKIPTGWDVEFNKFFEIDPLVLTENSDKWVYFTENMLHFKDNYNHVRMGWYPSMKPDGEFFLECNYKTPILPFKSRNKKLIVEKIEKVLSRKEF